MANDKINQNEQLNQRIANITLKLMKIRSDIRKLMPELDFDTASQLANINIQLELIDATLHNKINK